MKIKELKEIISTYTNEEKDKVIKELYQRIPNKVKEQYEIDDFIKNIKVSQQKEKDIYTINELEELIPLFISHARRFLYYEQNDIVKREERESWKNKIKIFYKSLNSYFPDTNEGQRATFHLTELWKLMSQGIYNNFFHSNNPFNSVKIPQYVYLNNIIMRKLTIDSSYDAIKECAELLEYNINEENIEVFLSNLKTKENIDNGIKALKNIIVERKDEYKKKQNTDYINAYYENRETNTLLLGLFEFCLALEKTTFAINLYLDYYDGNFHEYKIYGLLDKLEEIGLFQDWIKIYEQFNKKYNYEDKYINKYNEFKKSTKNCTS